MDACGREEGWRLHEIAPAHVGDVVRQQTESRFKSCSLLSVTGTAQQLDIVHRVSTVQAPRPGMVIVQMLPVPQHRGVIGNAALAAPSLVTLPDLYLDRFRYRQPGALLPLERFAGFGWLRREQPGQAVLMEPGAVVDQRSDHQDAAFRAACAVGCPGHIVSHRPRIPTATSPDLP